MLAPKSEAELAETIAAATEPLFIQGGGTRGASVEAMPLSTKGISGITLYEPGALTIMVKAGTPVAEVEAALAAENQMLAFEPMDHRRLLGTTGEPTIGGVVAANVSGPRRVQVGACRDFLLGVRFVDGQGNIIKNGGRVMKNVTGYDLARLLAGSRGTLGVLTEVGFKTLPRPDVSATLVYEGLDFQQSAALFAAAMASPFEVNGAARLPAGATGEPAGTVLRIEGFAQSVKYRAKALADLMDAGAPAVIFDADQNTKLWTSVRDVLALEDRPGDIWCLSLKPTEFAHLAERVPEANVVADWGGGRVWVLTEPGTDLRTRLDPIAGHATLVRGSAKTFPRFHPEIEPLAMIAARLRTQFDPRNILNPGLMAQPSELVA